MKDKTTLTRGWFLKADSDLANARRTTDSEGPYDTACFHVQQAIEKYLKGLMALHGLPIPRTHDLEELAVYCADLAPLAAIKEIRLAELTDYSVQVRYDFEVWPSVEEARQAVADAELIRTLVLSSVDESMHP